MAARSFQVLDLLWKYLGPRELQDAGVDFMGAISIAARRIDVVDAHFKGLLESHGPLPDYDQDELERWLIDTYETCAPEKTKDRRELSALDIANMDANTQKNATKWAREFRRNQEDLYHASTRLDSPGLNLREHLKGYKIQDKAPSRDPHYVTPREIAIINRIKDKQVAQAVARKIIEQDHKLTKRIPPGSLEELVRQTNSGDIDPTEGILPNLQNKPKSRSNTMSEGKIRVPYAKDMDGLRKQVAKLRVEVRGVENERQQIAQRLKDTNSTLESTERELASLKLKVTTGDVGHEAAQLLQAATIAIEGLTTLSEVRNGDASQIAPLVNALQRYSIKHGIDTNVRQEQKPHTADRDPMPWEYNSGHDEYLVNIFAYLDSKDETLYIPPLDIPEGGRAEIARYLQVYIDKANNSAQKISSLHALKSRISELSKHTGMTCSINDDKLVLGTLE